MTDIRLKSLVVENFRSLRGKIVVPLDAQVVLVHGANGMGKTSVLSAIELGLTGKVAHLAASGNGYRAYLTAMGTDGGSVALTTTRAHTDGGPVNGTLSFGESSFLASPLLRRSEARFFAERCYLPQATLGRLLEIYDDQTTGSASRLTLFVKELLGLDPLDALVDGLDPAFNVTRVRKIAPDYRRLEALKVSLQAQRDKARDDIREAGTAAEARRSRVNASLARLPNAIPPVVVTDATNLPELRLSLNKAQDKDRRIVDLDKTRAELRSLNQRWRELPPKSASRDQAQRERADQIASQSLQEWRAGPGASLDKVVAVVRALFTDIPTLDDDPEKVRGEALRRALAEQARCEQLLKAHELAVDRAKALTAVVQRAATRIEELNNDLSGAVRDAKNLASALAGIVPHIVGETCPVCDRDFAGEDVGPLTAHIAAKIASLTSEAGRLQTLATERANESTRQATAQRDLLGAGNGQLPPEQLSEITVRRAQMEDSSRQLHDLAGAAAQGSQLMTAAAAARQTLILARRHEEISASLLPEIENTVKAVLGQPASTFQTIELALDEALRQVDGRAAEAERLAAQYLDLQSELEHRLRELQYMATLRKELARDEARMEQVDKALKEVDIARERSKKVSDAASAVRSNIVKKVFSTSLNRVWRDLFLRLAPSEQFVPAFKLPSGSGGNVQAVLETLHRSGKPSGSPGAMLSQGNLNTAALTLFLSLHLSVPMRMPWLVLDDPVQSMDDLHVAQFAALLRTLSKGMNRQVVVAVHERALFDYLTLELSPAFPGDSLITVEMTRSSEGAAVVTPHAFSFEKDQAIAA